MTSSTDPSAADVPGDDPRSMREHWEQLVAVAMLGTDRRNPPEAPGVIAAVVDDTVRDTPAERMLAQVAATVAVRRAGVLPSAAVGPLLPVPSDDRPPIDPAAAERWYDITSRWPVLEDEWTIALIEGGWRVRPDLVPDLLMRHRSDDLRRARAVVACGPLAEWLVRQLPELGGRGAARPLPPDEQLLALPELPIPADLWAMLDQDDPGEVLAAEIISGRLAHAHRAVSVNLVARADPGLLSGIVRALRGVDAGAPGGPLAASLADLARTRDDMRRELVRAER